MNAIELLTHDHRDVDDLFERIQAVETPEARDELAKEIVHELSIHAAIEEQFLYPFIRHELDDGDEGADHSIEEHAEVKKLLTTIEKSDAGSADHDEAIGKVIESVRHHVEEEEGDIFPPLKDRATEERLEQLGTVMESAKKVVPTHPHPLVPGNATAQLVAGPWAAIIDKARDLVKA